MRRVKQTFCLQKLVAASSIKRMIAMQASSASSMFHVTPVNSRIVNHFHHHTSLLSPEKDEKVAVNTVVSSDSSILEWETWPVEVLRQEMSQYFSNTKMVAEQVAKLEVLRIGALQTYTVKQLEAKGIETPNATFIVQYVAKLKRRAEEQQRRAEEQQVLQTLKQDFQTKLTAYKEKQELAKSHLTQALAKGKLEMPENTRVSYFSPSPNTNSITLNLEETYPKNKYDTWEDLLNSGDKTGSYPALVIGALSGSGKTYFEFHLAKKKIPVILFTTVYSSTLVTALEASLKKNESKPSDIIRLELNAIVQRFVDFYKWTVFKLREMFAAEPDINLYLLRYLFNGGSAEIQNQYDKFGSKQVPDTPFSEIVYAIDEAVQFGELSGAVPRTVGADKDGNLLTLLVAACRKSGPVVCFSTKFSEEQIQSFVSGAADRKGATTVIGASLPPFFMNDVKYFLDKFVHLSGFDLELVAFFLQGRPRLCELFMNAIVNYGKKTCTQSSTTFIQGVLAEYLTELKSGRLITSELKAFLATKANIRDAIISRHKYAWELMFFGYCTFNGISDSDATIRDVIYTGIGCTITANKEAFLIEPAMKMTLQPYVANNLEDETFVQMMQCYVNLQLQASAVAELIAASCICSFLKTPVTPMPMTDHPLFHGLKGTVYDKYNVQFSERVVIHDHGEITKLTSNLGKHQISSTVLKFLLTDVEKNKDLLLQLKQVILVPCRNNRADIIAFAEKLQLFEDDKTLPSIIPVIISVNRFVNRPISSDNRFVNRSIDYAAIEKLQQDLQITKISNLYSTSATLKDNSTYARSAKNSAHQDKNTVQTLGVTDLHDVVKCVERTNIYVRVLFHPWLSTETTSQTSLKSLLLATEESTSSFQDGGFAALSNSTGVIQVSKNSPAFNRIKKALSTHPGALELFDSIVTRESRREKQKCKKRKRSTSELVSGGQ